MLSEVQRKTLQTAEHHARRQHLYCGDVDIELELGELVTGVFMRFIETPPWLSKGDAYYEITQAGRKALEKEQADG